MFEEGVEVVAVASLPILLTVAVIAVRYLPTLRVLLAERRANALPDDDVCVACASKSLVMLAPRAYRCAACGFEAGPGIPELRRARELAAIGRMPPEERSRSGIRDLQRARLELLGVEGLLANAATLGARDVLNADGDRGETKESLIAAAVLQMKSLHEAIQLAQTKLNSAELPAPEVGVNLASPELVLDTMMDGIAVDVAVQVRIFQLQAQVEAMRASVERTLCRLGAPLVGALVP